ncbi:MAG: UDP-2,3-diacylglucosamine diphosphatase LpxI [Alphaproteobacteria bacterium]|nr:UDP-2,3-diacylglucosamine diphosphatase LpxI [Alphaproteobacteria bacterium]
MDTSIRHAGADEADSPLALVCGGGTLPAAVAQAAERQGRRVVMFPVSGWAEPSLVQGRAHHWIALVQAGRFLKLLREEGCRDIVFIGTAVRPPFSLLRIDWETLRALPGIWRAYRGGDDHLLSSIAEMLAGYGFRIVGAHEIAPEILIPRGPLGGRAPNARDEADIARGLALLRAMGPFDVGQAVVVADNHVLGVEAAEGTDGLLARIAELRRAGRISTPIGVGVLIKAPKPEQDRRFDLPAIGPRTIIGAAQAGLAGVAVVAGGAILAEGAAVVEAANRENVFVVGVDEPQP